jgi:outer membrane autotransporter protein
VLLQVSCAIGTAAFAQPALTAPPWNDPIQAGRLQQAIDQALARNLVPGAAVSIVQGDQRWVSYAGMANVEAQTAAKAETSFGYRSITKSFVSTVILQLAQEGRISLNDPVSRYVAGVPDGDRISVRQLAEMRSGLANYSASPAFGAALGADPGRAWTARDLLALSFAEPLQFAPGTSYQYSNTNTILLGEIISAVTGTPWSEEVRRRLTAPLGLSSVVNHGAGALPAPAATGYVDAGDGPEATTEFSATGLGAAGALVGVLGDLERWGKAVGSGELLGQKEFVSRLKAFGSTKSDPASPEYDSYGFGMGEISGWIGHTGDGLGFQSLVMYDRASDRTITILLNASNADHDAPAHLFRDLLAILGWTEPSNQRQVAADGETRVVASGPTWTGLVSGPFGARAAIYAGNGGIVSAAGPVTLAPGQDYVPAIFVTRGGSVALEHSGTITASPGGDGAVLQGDGGRATLSLSGMAIDLRGNAVSGTGIDVGDGGLASLSAVSIRGTANVGLHAAGTAPATISGTGVDIDLLAGHGVWADANGVVSLSDSRIVLRGEGHGLVANGFSGRVLIAGSGLTVETGAPGSFAVRAQGPGAMVSLLDASLTSHGAGGHSIVLGDGAAVALTRSRIRAEGSGAAAIAAMSTAATTGVGSASLILSNTQLSAASGLAVVTSGTSLALAASDSILKGAIVTAGDAAIDLGLERSIWLLPSTSEGPPSTAHRILNRNSTIQFAPPVPAAIGAPAFQQLTVSQYHGEGGTLVMNAALGGNGAAADRLVIDGGAATGQSLIRVQGTGGGLTAGDGVRLVEARNGGSTEATAFALDGRVASGAYDYQLQRGGASGRDDWFLRSTRPAQVDGTAALPALRTEVALNLALPAMAGRLGQAMLGTYAEREGGRGSTTVAGEVQRSAAWARTFGETGRRGSTRGSDLGRFQRFMSNGPAYEIGLAGFQTGLDLYRDDSGQGVRNAAGLYLGAGRVEGDVEAVYGGRAGRVTMDAYTLGGYWTRSAEAGWYLDAVLQGTFYDQARTVSALAEKSTTDGWGLLGSLEAGYKLALGAGWSIEPQAQLSYQHLSFAGSADRYGQVAYRTSGTLQGRLGARLSHERDLSNGSLLTTWARVSLKHAFEGGGGASLSDLSGANALALAGDQGGSWAQLGAGASVRMSDAVSLYAAADYNQRLDSQGGHGVGFRLGAQVSW